MKWWLTPTLVLFLFSGCKSTQQNIQLQNRNAQQALLIEQQQIQIEALSQRSNSRRSIPYSQELPTPPKKNIKLKKVEDNNFDSEYMYPQTKHKTKKVEPTIKTPTQTTSTSPSMTKESCITMIGQDKFNKYTKMFGNEAASIKRCAMLKAMKH
ncbi:MAG: hypothetical protein L3J43_02290 [Sulfurovum sp.]|nr:hypothetical protein [Sulfurovum sp.]